MSDADVRALLAHYPRIFLACHRRHVRDPESGHTLSGNQASILDHLDEVEPTALSELAAHMGVTAGTMSVAVERLVQAGYVSRERDPDDARRVQLRVTEAGARVKDAGSVLDPELVRQLLRRLTPAEREAALAGLALLAEAADTMDRSAEGADEEGEAAAPATAARRRRTTGRPRP